MPEPSPDDLARLMASLRKWLRGQDEREQRLSRAQGRLLLDELSRLQQSNDRLRKQNRRLRTRTVNEPAADEVVSNDGPAPASEPTPAEPDHSD